MANFTCSLLALITLLTWCTGIVALEPTHQLVTSYAGRNFLDAFKFITADDPNGGYVEHVNRRYANDQYLTNSPFGSNATSIRADHWHKLEHGAKGRKSVWLESHFTFGSGTLMTAKVTKVPSEQCGTWPSFYTVNKQESAHFTEVDLYEGANLDNRNEMTVWVGESAGCRGAADDVHFRKHGGAVRNSWLHDPRADEYSPGITLVMSIEHDKIRAWRFPLGQEPIEIGRQDALLDIDSWPAPTMEYTSNVAGCDVGRLFSNQTLALKLNFCGYKAGGIDWERSGCAAKTGMSCEQWVEHNATDLRGLRFEIEYVKLFNVWRKDVNALVKVRDIETNLGLRGRSSRI